MRADPAQAARDGGPFAQVESAVLVELGFERAGHRLPVAQSLARASASANRVESERGVRFRLGVGVSCTDQIEEHILA